MSRRIRSVLGLACLALAATRATAAPRDYFGIQIVDDQTGRGVPLAYLQTTYKTRYVTDSNGYVAFNEPGLMDGNLDVWFEVSSYGYESPTGSFGVKGVALKPKAGTISQVKLKRTNIAERLYRMSGFGVYRDTLLLGKAAPIRQPAINAQVTGQDTVQTAIYRNKMFWLWQDTDRVGFALGCFSMTGGTSALPEKLDPDKGIDVTYFADKPGEFAKPMAHVEREGTNPIWLDGLTVIKDKAGRDRMLGKYIAANKDFSPAEAGLLVYNDDQERFELLKRFENKGKGVLAPGGHPVRVRDGEQTYIYYPGHVRVKADFESAADPANYEAFTCLLPDGEVDRVNGKLNWSWRRGAEAIHRKQADELVRSGKIKAEESPFQFVDAESGKRIEVAGGTVAWNAYLNRWVYVFGQQMGDSLLGEIWIGTANSPEGPWRECRKVATHAMPRNNNDFYNVVQHDELQRENGRFIYFSGTFVNTFSGNPWPTPYYDYNNIMYRIDLSDPRLKLPEPPPGLSRVTAEPANIAASRR